MDKTSIRFVEQSDMEDLIQLCRLHALYEKSEYAPKNKVQELSKHLFADIPNLYCLVVEQSEKLIGYATYMRQFSTWDSAFYIYMDCLFISDESRGLGIGEKLIREIKTEAAMLGCNLIQWQTPTFNTRAMKFYDRIGGISKTKERYFLKL
jgi:GNAT superfamily N-acetyltransferase